jgi:hypothetical protein
MNFRLSLILALAVSMFATTLTAENTERMFSVDGTSIRITALENSKTVMVTFNNTSKGEVVVALEDVYGSQFASDKVKSSERFSKKYNLSQLEAGNYRLVVTKNLSKTVQPFQLTNSAVVLNEFERKEKFLPSIKVKGNMLDVNVLLGNYSNIIVKVYSNDGLVTFEDKNYVVLTLHKRFDLSRLASGSYIVEVIAGDETQYYSINL